MANQNTTTKKTFDPKDANVTLAGLWKTRNGNYWTLDISDKQFLEFQKVNPNGRVIVKFMDPEKRDAMNAEREANGQTKVPDGFLEYIAPQKVKAFMERVKSGEYTQTPSETETARPSTNRNRF